jgi:cell division control protein 7
MAPTPKYILDIDSGDDSDYRREEPIDGHDPEGEDPIEEEEVDEIVKEDMKRLEDTFPGISSQFRLVNRIGEGMA